MTAKRLAVRQTAGGTWQMRRCRAVRACRRPKRQSPRHRPRDLTASTGLDALTQLIEPYVSLRANPMTDQFCVEGMQRAAGALPRVWENGRDREARCDMAWASLLGD